MPDSQKGVFDSHSAPYLFATEHPWAHLCALMPPCSKASLAAPITAARSPRAVLRITASVPSSMRTFFSIVSFSGPMNRSQEPLTPPPITACRTPSAEKRFPIASPSAQPNFEKRPAAPASPARAARNTASAESSLFSPASKSGPRPIPLVATSSFAPRERGRSPRRGTPGTRWPRRHRRATRQNHHVPISPENPRPSPRHNRPSRKRHPPTPVPSVTPTQLGIPARGPRPRLPRGRSAFASFSMKTGRPSAAPSSIARG